MENVRPENLGVIARNSSLVLILEDDADWDVGIKEQLRHFAISVQALTQP